MRIVQSVLQVGDARQGTGKSCIHDCSEQRRGGATQWRRQPACSRTAGDAGMICSRAGFTVSCVGRCSCDGMDWGDTENCKYLDGMMSCIKPVVKLCLVHSTLLHRWLHPARCQRALNASCAQVEQPRRAVTPYHAVVRYHPTCVCCMFTKLQGLPAQGNVCECLKKQLAGNCGPICSCLEAQNIPGMPPNSCYPVCQ